MVKDKELEFLLQLLDDPDPAVYQHVSDKLISLGASVVPSLEDVHHQAIITNNDLLEKHVEYVIGKIDFNALLKKIKIWLDNPNRDLLKGIMLIAAYSQPDVRVLQQEERIERIRRDIYFQLSMRYSPLKIVSIINQVFYDVYEYETAKVLMDFHFFANYMLSFRKGSPILMTIVYLLIARKLNLAIYPVNVSSNFLLAYIKKRQEPTFDNMSLDNFLVKKIELFIDPSNKGAIYRPREIRTFLEEKGVGLQAEKFAFCTDLDILNYLINDLCEIYKQGEKLEKISELKLINAMITSKITRSIDKLA
ncbi:MAG: transglutaminase family protein [Chitinophagales bacterium]